MNSSIFLSMTGAGAAGPGPLPSLNEVAGVNVLDFCTGARPKPGPIAASLLRGLLPAAACSRLTRTDAGTWTQQQQTAMNVK